MKTCTALLIFAFFLSAASGSAQDQFILHADPTKVPAITGTYGLTLLNQVPNHSISLVLGPPNVSDQDVIGEVDRRAKETVRSTRPL